MKKALLFEFQVNRDTQTMEVKREFDAGLSLVWDAWTRPEILDQWWAPRPYHIETKALDLREGGKWIYAMVSPEGERFYCLAEYQGIEAPNRLGWLDAFCDENGVPNDGKPRSLWRILFTEKDGVTLVEITIYQDRLEDLEWMVQAGFKEGFSMAMGNLDEVLAV